MMIAGKLSECKEDVLARLGLLYTAPSSIAADTTGRYEYGRG